MNDVYQYHLPPVRRIPPLLWTRIRNDLSYYFTERRADGVNVIDWYHRHFDEVSRERYFRNVNVLRETHAQMADYFLGVWGGVPKPFEYTDLQCQRFGLESSTGSCDRKVPEQPLFFTDEFGRVNRYNLRKLSELPYHLIRAKRFEQLYHDVLFSFRWLHAKLNSMPLQSVLADFDDILSYENEPSVEILADTIRLSASVLSRYPDMLTAQIVGRLLPYYSSHDRIRDLLNQCDAEGARVNALIPCHRYLHTPGGPLEHSLEGHPFAPFGIGVTSDGRYFVSVSSIFIIWDLTTGNVFRQMSPGVKGIMRHLAITSDDRTAVTYTNNNQVIICTILTGDFKVLEDVAMGADEIIDAAVSSGTLLIWSLRDWFLYAFDGTLLDSCCLDKHQGTIVYMDLGRNEDEDERYLIRKLDETMEDEVQMILDVTKNGSTEGFLFHSAIALSKNKRTLYACTMVGNNAISRFRRLETKWIYDRTLENKDAIYSLLISPDDRHVVATVIFGYKRWEVATNSLVLMRLPVGVRNIPRFVQILTAASSYTSLDSMHSMHPC